jgi:hypothetical protein
MAIANPQLVFCCTLHVAFGLTKLVVSVKKEIPTWL